MKREIFGIMVLTMPFISCKENGVPKDDDNNDKIQKSTVSFKADGTEFDLSRDSNDSKGDFPSFVVLNGPDVGLIVQFSPDGKIIFQFAGDYLANSSQDYKEGHMSYADKHQIGTVAGLGYDSYSWDRCSSDSFKFQVQQQSAGIASNPKATRFTGTFSGTLVYYHGTPGDGTPDDPCANPEFLQITDGKFSVIGLNN